jgi:hypothetical protein
VCAECKWYPSDSTKTLTASGKLSIKPISKKRFHEIYQDHVCGCVLRVAREVFALLPVETALITAFVQSRDTRTGGTAEQPVLSVETPRAIVAKLDFNHLDPSDAMQNFQHRGDLKASRKNETFDPIIPLTAADLARTVAEDRSFERFVIQMETLHKDVKQQIANLGPTNAEFPQTTSSL